MLCSVLRRLNNGVRYTNHYYILGTPPLNNSLNQNQIQRDYSFQSSLQSVIQTQTNIFQSLSNSTPVEYLQTFVVNLHDTTGLPWWATIICTTVLLRSVITVPLAVYQNYITGKLQNLGGELNELAKELRKEVAIATKMYKWDNRTANYNFKRSMKKQWNILIVRENCHPVKASLLIWFQIPMWICFSVTLRNLVYMLPIQDIEAQNIYNQLCTEGMGWFTNLTQTDPLFLLPLILGITNLAIIEIQALSRVGAPTKFQRYALNFFRFFSIFMVPITACVPSCVALYWTTSSMFGLFQNLLLMSPKVRRACRIPNTNSELQHPYKHIAEGIKNKINLIGKFGKIS